MDHFGHSRLAAHSGRIDHRCSHQRGLNDIIADQLTVDQVIALLPNLVCSQGHAWRWRQDNRACPQCADKRKEAMIARFEKTLERAEFTCDSRPKELSDRVRLSCKNGHVFLYSVADVLTGLKCSICMEESRKAADDLFEKRLVSLGFRIIERPSVREPWRVECTKGHPWFTHPSKRIMCPTCRRSVQDI